MNGMPVPSLAQIQSRVRKVLREQFGDSADDVADDSQLVDTLENGYDSLAALECITRIEAEFGIEVDFVTHDVRHWFATPGRIAQFVRDQVEDQAMLGASR